MQFFNLSIALALFLTAAALTNPVLAFFNSKRNGLATAILISGLLSAIATGYLFYLNYKTTQFLTAGVIMNMGQ